MQVQKTVAREEVFRPSAKEGDRRIVNEFPDSAFSAISAVK